MVAPLSLSSCPLSTSSATLSPCRKRNKLASSLPLLALQPCLPLLLLFVALHVLPLFLSFPFLVPVSALPPSPPQHNVWYFALHVTGIAVDELSGDVYMSDANKHRIIRQSSGGTLLQTLNISSPTQLALSNGILYVADSSTNRIVLIVQNALTGDLTVQGSIDAPSGVTACSCIAVSRTDGSLFVADGWGGRVAKLERASHKVIWSLALNTTYIAAVTLDASDMLHIADSSPSVNRILRIFSNGTSASTFPQPADVNLTTIRSIYWSSYPSPTSPLGALYVLFQPPSLDTVHLSNPATRVVRLSASGGLVESEWRGIDPASTCPITFNSWPAALYVDSSRGDVFFSDAIRASQGCLTCCDGAVHKMSPDGQLQQSYRMTDEPWTSLHAIHYDNDTCTLWYAFQISSYGSSLTRMALDGRTALQSFSTPDYSDIQQHFLLIVADPSTSSLLLVAQVDPYSTSRLYRFSPTTQRFTLLNYEYALRQGSRRESLLITGLAVDELGFLYVSVAFPYLSLLTDQKVVKLTPDGGAVLLFNATARELGNPSHLVVAPVTPASSYSSTFNSFTAAASLLFIIDQGSPPNPGRLLLLNSDTGRVIRDYNSLLPTLYLPQTLLFDPASSTLYVADLNGNIFQLDPYTDTLLNVYITVPTCLRHLVTHGGSIRLIVRVGRV